MEKDDLTEEERKMLKIMDATASMPYEEKRRTFATMMENQDGSVDDIMATLNIADEANQTVEEGYSSIEIPAETDSE